MFFRFCLLLLLLLPLQFEYQQAQLEAEIENLSWKIERAEIMERGDILNQMDVAEKRRTTMLREFIGETNNNHM